MTRKRRTRGARPVGLALGVVLALAALWVWRVPSGWGTLGTQVSIAVNRSGPLAISPTGPLVSARNLRPGLAGVAGHATLRNQTAQTALIRLRSPGAVVDLDRSVHVEVHLGTRLAFRGALSELREWTPSVISLPSTAEVPVTLRAWLPPASREGYQGRVLATQLEFDAQPAGG